METHIANRKDHRCDECGRKIPIGARYFSKDGGDHREHSNCMDYEAQPLLEEFYNKNRSNKRLTPNP